jgi:hypothetical protein
MKQLVLAVGGGLLRLCPLPPLLLLEMLSWLELLESRPELSEAIAEKLVAVHGVDPAVLDPGTAVALIPDLIMLNSPDAPAGGDGVSVEAWLFSLIAALVETEGVDGAISVAGKHRADLLSGILNARAKQLSEDPPITSEEYKKTLSELDASILDHGNFIPPNGNPATFDL